MNALVCLALLGLAAALPAELKVNVTTKDGGCCRPFVDNWSVDSKIEAISGDRGNVVVVPSYGSCAAGATGWSWKIYWGDGEESSGTFNDLTPLQQVHQYDRTGVYFVKMKYCKANVGLVNGCRDLQRCFIKVALINTGNPSVSSVCDASSDTSLGLCCGPNVEDTPDDFIVEALPGKQGHVAVVPGYGSCKAGAKNWRWSIHWGDGDEDKGSSVDLTPIQKLHQYSSDGSYKVSVSYCKKSWFPFCKVACFRKSVTINTNPTDKQLILPSGSSLQEMFNYTKVDTWPFPQCCGPDVDNMGTDFIVEALPGDRGHVVVVPDYGSCQAGAENWRWKIYWGDGQKDQGYTKSLSPIQKLHQYSQAGVYNVHVVYCKQNIWKWCEHKCFSETVTICTASANENFKLIDVPETVGQLEDYCSGCSPSVADFANDVHFSAFGANQLSVAVVPDYGTCGAGSTGWEYCVFWGDFDGHRTCSNFDQLTPFQVTHTYERAGKYFVSFAYCKGDVSLWCARDCYSAGKWVDV